MKQFKNEIWDGKIWKKNRVCHCSQTFTLCSLYMTTILLYLKPYSAFIGKLKINKRDKDYSTIRVQLTLESTWQYFIFRTKGEDQRLDHLSLLLNVNENR